MALAFDFFLSQPRDFGSRTLGLGLVLLNLSCSAEDKDSGALAAELSSAKLSRKAMTQTRLRSPSPPASNKRAKRFALTDDIESRFTSGLLAHTNALKLNQEYLSSEPYKYCIIDKLIDDALLTQVKDECIDQLSFTEKSTDIYKVWRC